MFSTSKTANISSFGAPSFPASMKVTKRLSTGRWMKMFGQGPSLGHWKGRGRQDYRGRPSAACGRLGPATSGVRCVRWATAEVPARRVRCEARGDARLGGRPPTRGRGARQPGGACRRVRARPRQRPRTGRYRGQRSPGAGGGPAIGSGPQVRLIGAYGCGGRRTVALAGDACWWGPACRRLLAAGCGGRGASDRGAAGDDRRPAAARVSQSAAWPGRQQA